MTRIGAPLFPSAFTKRRMGVAVARASDTDTGRAHAKKSASLVKPG